MGQQNGTFHAVELLDEKNFGKPWPLKFANATPEPNSSF
jgi:hypothetical protein